MKNQKNDITIKFSAKYCFYQNISQSRLDKQKIIILHISIGCETRQIIIPKNVGLV